jgi:murein DD-endopeptidase MepM/ murein hydrolase activator NlpD
MLLLSWMMVGFGGYWGVSLYYAYLQLKKENTRLIQKETELDALLLTMKRIRRNEEIVRDTLSQERKQIVEGGLGQGGIPGTDPSLVVARDAPVTDSITPRVQFEYPSVLDQARALEESLEELLGILHERRQLLNRIPSILPVEAQAYRITSGFGWRRSPFTGLRAFHEGLDISAPRGTPIVAPGEGRVTSLGRDRDRGKYLKIDHGNQCITTYAHLSRFNVTMGQKVKRGKVIAYMGNTGRSTGCHLHYEIEIKGKVVDPLNFILSASAN